MFPPLFSDRSKASDFNWYRMVATRFGQTEVPYELEGASSELKEELEVIHASSEYLLLAQSFFALVMRECEKAKTDIQTLGAETVIQRMPALISLVNSVGYLRGQDGMFLDDRPTPAMYIQSLLYKLEDEAEKKLHELIESMLASETIKERYKERLMNYFVRSRSGEKVTNVW